MDFRIEDFRPWQESCMSEYGFLLVVKIEVRQRLCEIHMNLEKTLYGPYILPVPVEEISLDIFFGDRGRDNFSPKIFEGGVFE